MGMKDIPQSFKIGDHWKFDRESARWAFDYVDFHTQVAYSFAIQDVRKAQEMWEGKALSMIPVIDKKALALMEKDPAKARDYLTEVCSDFAEQVIKAWWSLGDDLLVKYNHLWHYDVEKRTKEQLTYPDWWMKAIIEHDGLKSQEEIKK
jgi:dipeptidase